jgi:hypothetical protein
MENRERDKMRNNTGSKSSSDLNRDSSKIGKDKSDSSVDFGKKDSQSEKLNEPNSRGSSGDSRH